ncbi:hypothetical protein [Bosea sp. NBC_00550]|uniref:hypothetical protein n=1 Tax=Bosea sp. NBC_00550 TaxID=2969621 RepID=UPI0022317B7F|nr:hypothetical protein [Bosea sp. NBC_00550]UZF95555.1 hypothetical protein NWE53_29220 [Bosea sp. NBC_00550]
MIANSDNAPLPAFLDEILARFVDGPAADEVISSMRPASSLTASRLSAMKATRVSFASQLVHRMVNERWRITREHFACDAVGEGHGVYRIDANGFPLTYIVRCYPWDGVEKVGRRSDGAKRDLFGALFIGHPDQSRIDEELAVFDVKDVDLMRTRSDVTGWTPASRSARAFDYVVDSLKAGRQPDPAQIGGGYILRNGGYQGNGRQGSLSVVGLHPDHPFRSPFFADLFGLCMIRQVSIDLVNGVAKAMNPAAAQLEQDVARFIGVGNSSGQGMCVALQRWPEWVASWLVVRELSLAYALTRPVDAPGRDAVARAMARSASYYAGADFQCEDYVTPPAVLSANLRKIVGWLATEAFGRWEDLAAKVAEFDLETQEQVNSLVIGAYPEFADAAARYIPIGMVRDRDIAPEMTAGELKRMIQQDYAWALRIDMRRSGARQHFWYHSVDNGEQRRGERIIDPHEAFESFTDHIGLIQRLSVWAASVPDETTVAEMLVAEPDLHYAIARVQYLHGLPYAEIRDNLIDHAFLPAYLIRFFLAMLGIDGSNPLSIRYVRGVFFQGLPLPEDIEQGAGEHWRFPTLASPFAEEQAA